MVNEVQSFSPGGKVVTKYSSTSTSLIVSSRGNWPPLASHIRVAASWSMLFDLVTHVSSCKLSHPLTSSVQTLVKFLVKQRL